MPILRVVCASFDSLLPSCAVIAAHWHPKSGWVSAPVAARLTRSLAAGRFAFGDIGQGHGPLFLHYIGQSPGWTGIGKIGR